MVFNALFQERVQQRLVEQMMSMTSSGAPKSLLSIPAVSSRFPLVMKRKMRKMRWRRRRRRRRWTLRSSTHASKAIFALGATVPPSSEVVSVGGARGALSRTRTTSSTQMYRDKGDGCPCDHAARVPAVRPVLLSGGASDPVHDQSAGHSCCIQSGYACRRFAVARSRLVLPVTMYLPLCSFCLSAGPRCWHHGFCGFQEVAALVVDNRSGILCWFYWYRYTLFCVPLSVGRPVMPGIMVGMFLLIVAPVVRSNRCHGFCRCEHAATSSSSPF